MSKNLKKLVVSAIKDTLEFVSNYSLYAYEDEIKQGYITVKGGHRVGIAGKVVTENSKIKSVRHISFINIRMSHEVKGCGDRVIKYISDMGKLYHTLIISPPRCGKTTLLRDIIRLLSNGNSGRNGVTVGVIKVSLDIAYKGVEGILELMRGIIPVYALSLASCGYITTSAAIYEVLIIALGFTDSIILKVVFPLINMYVTLKLINSINTENRFLQMAELFKGSSEWILKSLIALIIGINMERYEGKI